MAKAEGFVILDTHNNNNAALGARPRTQSIARAKLADISNLVQKPGPVIQEKRLESIVTGSKEYIDQLQKENMTLVKMLAQKNKIIEQSGNELNRLRVNLLKMREQNQQLALSNTHMLAELNSGKDRLKTLQHELGCKSGLLKARTVVLEEKAITRPCKNSDVEFQKETEPTEDGREAEKPRNTKRKFSLNSLVGSSEQIQSKQKIENTRPSTRRQSARFKAAETVDLLDGPVPDKESTSENVLVKIKNDESNSELSHESQEFEKAKSSTGTCKNSNAELIKSGEDDKSLKEVRDDKKPRNSKRSLQLNSGGSSENLQPDETANKRLSLRRQSARYKVADAKPAEHDELPCDPIPEKRSTSENVSVKNEHNESDSGRGNEFGRSSPGRPSRVAAKRVQSYKEAPINVKMRRPN